MSEETKNKATGFSASLLLLSAILAMLMFAVVLRSIATFGSAVVREHPNLSVENPRLEQKKIDYTDYQAILSKSVNKQGQVDYKYIKTHTFSLERFIESLSSVSKDQYDSFSENEQIAFWLNAYNAMTLYFVAKNYPIQKRTITALVYPANSIRQIPQFWKIKEFYFLGQRRSLDEIEHEILRKEFTEARIHMALVCAAKSCPPLRRSPYQGEALVDQLNDQSHRFLNSQKGIHIDHKKKIVALSKIFDWFAGDFEQQYLSYQSFQGRPTRERAVLNFIRKYLSNAQKTFLESNNFKVIYHDYDWTLNEQED